MSVNYSEEEVRKAHEVLFNEGLKMRNKVAGKQYVDAALKKADGTFAQIMQQYVTESCWGSIWSRPGLPLKTRSFLNIAMLCNQNRSAELATHIKGAMNNGASEEEVAEVILQASCYCGMPSGMEGFRVAQKAIEEWKQQQQQAGHTVNENQDIGIAERVNVENV